MSCLNIFQNKLVIGLSIGLGIAFALVLTSLARAGSSAYQVNQEQAPTPPNLIYRVAKTGDGSDGSSWIKAYKTVQDALNSAGSGDEIWVASGVYTPGINQSDSFYLVPGVAMYGGFDGTEDSRYQRDWLANPTILSGDIEGNDTNTDGVVQSTSDIVGNNNSNVVFADGTTGTPILSNTIINSFSITAGNADGGGDPVYDLRGGGFFCDGSYNNNECSPSLENIKFAGNFAVHFGGAMYNFGNDNGTSAPILTNIIFTGNTVGDKGGAVCNDGGTGKSSPTLTNVIFAGNSAKNSGGAMFNNRRAGASSPTLTNVTFSGNSAAQGGAIYNDGWVGASAPHILNSILWNNMDNSGTGTISATIFNNDATVTVTHSLVEGSNGSGTDWDCGDCTDGGGNLDENPLFILDVNPSDAPTTTGNLRLQTGSPAIDTGYNNYISDFTTDLDGEARLRDGDKNGSVIVDMGAYEFQPKHLLVVTKSGSGDGTITSSPAGIDCGSVCSLLIQESTIITLSAAPDADSIFTGWSGACSGVLDCQLTMDAAKSVDAKFEIAQKVQLPLVVR